MSDINFQQVFGPTRMLGFVSLADLGFEQAQTLQIPEISLTTNAGNSIRFINHNRNKAKYCSELKKWVIWNGKYWQVDADDNNKYTIGIDTVLSILTEANQASTPDKKMELLKWCKQSQTPSHINAMLTLAASRMTVSWSVMDTNAYMLNVQNGTIDLRTGELLPHNPSHMNSKIAPVKYNPKAECPRFIRFMQSAFRDAPEMIVYMQKVLGYVLTGDTSEKCFFIFYGPGGNNGKSVLINVIRHILGPDYSVQTPVATLLAKRPGGNSNDIVRMKGARFVAASETNPGKREKIDEAQLKMLTGNDPITARELFKEYIEYYPEFKLFIGTNHLPQLNVADDALMDRVMIIPFRVSFTRDHPERDDSLLDQLKAEASGILNWAIAGCLLWQHEGLGAVPDRVELEIQPLNVREASIDRFLRECCDFQEGATQKCGALYDTYNTWCTVLNIVPVGNGIFSRHLTEHYALVNGKIGSTGFHWFGLTLKEGSQEPHTQETVAPE